MTTNGIATHSLRSPDLAQWFSNESTRISWGTQRWSKGSTKFL